MLEKSKRRSKLHLMNLIGNRINNTPNFSILIGAGASHSSGVKPTSQIINEWRKQLYKQSKSRKKIDDWLLEQNWYEDDEEYSILFEMLYDKPSQRRNYIEQCVKNAKPSWGYIYLANLISKNFFNVCFTPNFDDLLNEACCFYTDIKPIVCAHDSVVADIRITSKRPKIIKLHGDFLYDSIKNTIRETETLEQNMRDKFSQFAREYGLIVIGYGGNDRSIMDILEMSARSKDFFPQGIYWCLRKNSHYSRKLERLMHQENIFWVEIDGFDEFMAELHEDLDLTLPDAVRDPYAYTTKRLNCFILPSENVDHPIIKKAISELQDVVKSFERIITSGKGTTEEMGRLVPYSFLGTQEYKKGNYETAINYFEKSIRQNPSDSSAIRLKTRSMIYQKRFKDALKFSNETIIQFPKRYEGYVMKGITNFYLKKSNKSIISFNKALKRTSRDPLARGYVLTARANSYLILGKWKKALYDAEKALEIVTSHSCILIKAFALKKLDKKEKAFKIIKKSLPRIKDAYLRACAYAGLEDKENMLKELDRAINQEKGNRMDAMYDPDFVSYHEDSDFKKLVQKNN